MLALHTVALTKIILILTFKNWSHSILKIFQFKKLAQEKLKVVLIFPDNVGKFSNSRNVSVFLCHLNSIFTGCDFKILIFLRKPPCS